MADTCIECDVAIVGSRFAGSLIAKELSRQRIKVVILEAGSGVQPNINGYMRSFYKASAKVPESPYPPALASAPSAVVAGRPTALMLSASNWNKPELAYLDQEGSTLPFKSTYERLAGGTSHWMGLTPRLVPNDFRPNDVGVRLSLPQSQIASSGSLQSEVPCIAKQREIGIILKVAVHSPQRTVR
jgi:choline dehydrogenase-like flavoprotein